MGFDIQSFDTNKNYVIEASAGTGKTYTIVEMVKKLLLSGITLDKMLIVTYTEKAAGELKDRIRDGLTSMSENIKNNPGNDVDNASIGTIHAFCQNTLNEFFISAGKPSCQKVINENEIREFLKRYLRSGDIYRDICKYKKWKPDITLENKLINKMTDFINKYYLNLNHEIVSGIIQFDAESLKEENLISSDPLIQYIFDNGTIQGYSKTEKTMEANLNTIKNSKYTYDKASMAGRKLNELYDILQNSKNMDFNNQFKLNQNDIKKGRISQDEYDAVNYFLDIQKKAKAYDKNFINYLVVHYIKDLYIAWQKEKDNLCAQTYNDMIRNVREEVLKSPSPLLNKLRKKYSYAIIDEFQDTNQKQWDIFKTVFMTDNHHMIVVGDPKQSIYSFQGADVTVYGNAKKDISDGGGELCSLERNFRATKNMIASTNDFFESNTALFPSLDFKPLDTNPGNEKFKVQYDGKETPAFWITSNEVSPEEYARIVCNRIADFCSMDEDGKTKLRIWDKDGQPNNVSFKDFAVLARTRSEMRPIQNAFEKCGIPYTQYKNKTLFTGQECAHWIAVLEAVLVPDFTGKNRSFFKKAMITSFFGYSLDDISSSDFDRDSIKEIGMFSAWREIAKDRAWDKLVERIIVDTDVFEKMQQLGDIKEFGILMQIGDYCVDYLSKTDSLRMLITSLRKQQSTVNDEEDDENSSIVAKSTDVDCVHVMTIHASKGLEFPIVISAAGFKGRKNSDSYSYHDDNNGYPCLYLSFEDNTKSKKERCDESQRLWYVAYTRAKYMLMLPQYACPKVDKDLKFVSESISAFMGKANVSYAPLPFTGKDGISIDESSLADLKPKVKEIWDYISSHTPMSPTDTENRIEELKQFGKSLYFHTSQKHAYSSLSHGSEKKNETKVDAVTIENDVLKRNKEEEPGFSPLSEYDTSAKSIRCAYDTGTDPISISDNFIGGTGIGNVLHRVFELIDYRDENTATDSLIQKCFAEEKIRVKAEWINDVKNMVHHVIRAQLPEIRGNRQTAPGNSFTLGDIPLKDRKNEVEFNFNITEKSGPHHYMNGFVDLIFRCGDFYSILDWKSDRLNDRFTAYNDSETIKTHVNELYSIQRVLYSYCLIKWLKQIYGGTEQEIFDQHFGGIYYIFLRGCNEGTGNGIYAQTWENYETLAKEYEKIVKKRVH